eukprot:GDKI01031311.1.p1 GENE.GDKI01031311.1~~GDKI01031311.1.p1  ORF type:complete len:118 (-),score=46.24 GDKI01031311.1:258-611(-)
MAEPVSPSNQITTFLALKESANRMVKTTVDNVLGTASYNPKDVQQWVDTITQSVMERLQELNDNFKYIVSAIILQRSNAGFHTSTTCFWDYSTDGSVTFRWENKTMYCIVTVYGVGI